MGATYSTLLLVAEQRFLGGRSDRHRSLMKDPAAEPAGDSGVVAGVRGGFRSPGQPSPC